MSLWKRLHWTQSRPSVRSALQRWSWSFPQVDRYLRMGHLTAAPQNRTVRALPLQEVVELGDSGAEGARGCAWRRRWRPVAAGHTRRCCPHERCLAGNCVTRHQRPGPRQHRRSRPGADDRRPTRLPPQHCSALAGVRTCRSPRARAPRRAPHRAPYEAHLLEAVADAATASGHGLMLWMAATEPNQTLRDGFRSRTQSTG